MYFEIYYNYFKNQCISKFNIGSITALLLSDIFAKHNKVLMFNV